MQATLLNIFSTIVIFQLLFLSCFLVFVRKGKRVSNRILASFFLLLAVNLSDGLLGYFGFYQQFPALAHMEDGFTFLFGPMLFFYTRSLTKDDFRFATADLVHFVPFLGVTIGFQIFYHAQSAVYQKFIQSSIYKQDLPPQFYFILTLVYAHVFIYILVSFRLIQIFGDRIRQKFSAIGKINLDWLSFMLGFFSFVLIFSFFYTFLPLTSMRGLMDAGLVVIMGFTFLFVNLIVIRALNQPQIFLSEQIAEKGKYAASTLPDHQKQQMQKTLNGVMNDKKMFLDPDLTLDQLAEVVQTSPRKLSQVINELFQQNFFDYINSLRIEHAKHIITSVADQKLTVLEIMYQSGFNSKSSFNTLFKKKTGITPSEFKRQFQKSV
jgi:AraC-like DNA-binding protein